jgi:hypothetical protein
VRNNFFFSKQNSKIVFFMRFLAISLAAIMGANATTTSVPSLTLILPQAAEEIITESTTSEQDESEKISTSAAPTIASDNATTIASDDATTIASDDATTIASDDATTTEWTTLRSASAQQDEEIITTESPIVGQAEYAALPDAEDLEGTAYRARSNSVRFSDDESFDDDEEDDEEDDIEANRQTEDNGMEFDPDWDLQGLGARLASANFDDNDDASSENTGDGNEVFDDEAYVLHGIVHQYASEYGIESDPLEGDSSSTADDEEDFQSTADPSETVVLGWVL